VFVGTFNAGKLRIAVENEQLRILEDGTARKFVAEVEHRTFSGSYARQRQQPVLYITERCVFRLGEQGLELVEVAPGVDLERDILAYMEFQPATREPLGLMDSRIFRAEPMGLRDDLLRVPLEQRFVYDPQQNLFFINLSHYTVKTLDDVEQIRSAVVKCLSSLGRKVYAIVNYDGFGILPDVMDPYSDMVKWLTDHFYSGVTRYTTSGFLRMKLGESLQKRGVAPHIYEGADEAREHLRDLEGSSP
jgi:propionate CoA-transferase